MVIIKVLLVAGVILMAWHFVLSIYDIIRGKAFMERDFLGRRKL